MGSLDSIPFIHAGIVSPIAELLAANGGNNDQAFQRAGVPVELSAAKGQILSATDYLALLESGAREISDPHFGVALGEELKIYELGPFGQLLAAAPTLGAVIATANSLIHHYSSAARSWLEVERGVACWRYRMDWRCRALDLTCLEGRRIDGELTLVLLRSLVRLAAGAAWQPQEVMLDRATARDVSKFQSRIAALCCRRHDSYGLVFPSDLLGLPMTCQRPLTESQRQGVFDRLAALNPRDSFVLLLKAIIRAQLHGGYPEISSVARSTGLSVRTLQRRLSNEGWTFSGLVSAVRQKAACELLADPDLGQIEVSLSLGYADTANFSRAFKKWTGTTPSAFRHVRV